MIQDGERDFRGYGRNPPDPQWPGGAKLAIVIVLNFEEGAEPSIPDGDKASEPALTDAIPGEIPAGTRDLIAETLFEYGSRVGFWRLHDLFLRTGVTPTINACARAMERNLEAAAAIGEAGFDLCCHGYGFVRHWLMEEAEERAIIARAVASLEKTVGRRPAGWQSRYSPSIATRRLLREHECFLYDSDSYADDWPYWVSVEGAPHLVVPHSFTHNDNRLPSGKLGTGDDWCDHLSAAFRTLYREGERGQPRMMTISLHNRITGQPSRFEGFERFLEMARGHGGVWFPGRSGIARHWAATHPPQGA